jgi:Ca2+-binding EF-hand superfamily protein
MKNLILVLSILLTTTAVIADEDKFSQLDADEDGLISIEEAAADAALAAVFTELDADKDGYLTPAEYANK